MKSLLNRLIVLCALGGIGYVLCSRMSRQEHECRGCICGCNKES